MNIVQIQIVTLDSERKLMMVEYRWLRIFSGGYKDFPFEAITEIRIENSEQSAVKLRLRTGKWIYPKSQLTSVKNACRLAEQIAALLGKRETSPGIWQ